MDIFLSFLCKKSKNTITAIPSKKNKSNELGFIYKKHTQDEGLISSYGKNINEAIRNRDHIALKSIEHMFNKISKMEF